ncbi:hypothetical protein C1646_774081 [Rhizophagus diaphanus]|nr:hypothetical protein C1646_774081 [Rhizophagus diaphanus] [Rhizophagus sp. MUCL 43196]
MIQEFTKVIPVNEQRLSTNGFTALSNNEYNSLIDESASFNNLELFWKIFAINHNIYIIIFFGTHFNLKIAKAHRR